MDSNQKSPTMKTVCRRRIRFVRVVWLISSLPWLSQPNEMLGGDVYFDQHIHHKLIDRFLDTRRTAFS